MKKFMALITSQKQDGTFENKICQKSIGDLPLNDLLVKVEYSSLNYKDALSASGAKGITKEYPHTPGIDVAGIIEESSNDHFSVGEKVIITGFDLGMNTSGGFAEYVRVPSKWAIKCPNSLSTKESMMIGTAGLTAGLCIAEIEKHKPLKDLKIIVSGATGGVGSIATKLLSLLGSEVTAITGKKNKDDFLYGLGCSNIIQREDFINLTRLPLNRGNYDAAVDVAGGNILSCMIASMNYNGIITACGNVASPKFETTVFPFILRSNKLIGIDSANCSLKIRQKIWNNFSNIWRLSNLEKMYKTVDLNNLINEIDKILSGRLTGRVIIKI